MSGGVEKALDDALGDVFSNNPPQQKPQVEVIGDYVIGKLLGSGSFSRVYEAQSKHGPRLAAKVFSRSVFVDPRRLELLEREIHALKQMDHPNVVRLHDLLQTRTRVCLLLELVDGWTLVDEIKEAGMDPERARPLFRQIVRGIDHIHARGVAHRDIKPENVLVDRATGNVKLTDFGLSKPEDTSGSLQKQSVCGTPYFLAPEIIHGQVYNGKVVDMWALGVLLFIMLTGKKPFTASTLPDLFANIRTGSFTVPAGVPPDAAELIKKLLVVDPLHRAKLADVKASDWYTTGATPDDIKQQ